MFSGMKKEKSIMQNMVPLRKAFGCIGVLITSYLSG